MKTLLDFIPLILFFAAFKLYGMYVAIVVTIAASLVQVGWLWLRERRFETSQVVTLAVIAVFGGLSLLLHDVAFIKWKPTIVNWIFAVLVLGSHWFGPRTALERLLDAKLALPTGIWRKVNFSWGLFFLAMGVLNLYVAFYFRLDVDEQTRTEIWVNFKVFWMMGITLVFSVVQMLCIARYLEPDKKLEDS